MPVTATQWEPADVGYCSVSADVPLGCCWAGPTTPFSRPGPAGIDGGGMVGSEQPCPAFPIRSHQALPYALMPVIHRSSSPYCAAGISSRTHCPADGSGPMYV